MSDATTALAAAQAAAASASTAGEAATGAAESVATALEHRNAAQTARDEAQDAARTAADDAVAAVGPVNDTVMTSVDGNAGSAFRVQADARLAATFVSLGGIVMPGATAAQIQAKADACAAAGTTLGIPAGTWDTSAATITFHCSVLADPEAVFTSDATPAVKVGTGSTNLTRARLRLPKVTRKTKNWGIAPGPGAGVINTDVGVRIDDTRTCEIHVPHVQNFSVGVDIADDAGSLYNQIHIGHLDNNAVNLRAATTGAGGAANEAQFLGGRYSHNSGEGTNVVGTRHIALLTGATVGPNNMLFSGGSIEGDTAEYHLECTGSYNQFIGLRWEATTPKALFTTAAASKNRIVGGYGADGIVVTQSGGAVRNVVESAGVSVKAPMGGGANGAYIIQPTGSSDHPAITVLETSQDVYGTGGSAPSATYAATLTAQHLRGKRAADANPRVDVDFNNGKIGFGSGTAAITQFLRQETSTLLGFQATGICASTDNTYDIGASGTRRFRDLFLGRNAVIGGELDHDGTRVGFYGTAPALKPSALTAANASAVNSGDATTDTVIANMRTRINELEAKLQSLGLIT